nr:DUF4013 domain-containing protein [Anaerolineae bacterium]
MRLFEALIYPFRERRWPLELLVAILVAAVPVLGYLVIKGWELEISTNVRYGREPVLPGWQNLGNRLLRGFGIRVASFLFNIPTLVMLTLSVTLWVQVFVWYFTQEVHTAEAFQVLMRTGLALRIGVIIATVLVAFLSNSLFWAGYLRYIDTRQFRSFFLVIPNVRLAFSVFWDDLVTAIFLGLFGLVMMGLNSLLIGALSSTGAGAFLAPILVPAITFSLTSLFRGHLFGQLARRTLDT